MRSAGLATLLLIGGAVATTPPPGGAYCCHSEGGCVIGAGCAQTKAACEAGCNKPPTPAPPPPTPPPATAPPQPPVPTPPPGPAVKPWLCDEATKKCSQVPAGTAGSKGKEPCEAECAGVPTPPPATVYKCDTTDGACKAVGAGTPGASDKGSCEKNCKVAPTPAPATPRPPPPPPTYNCDDTIGKCWANAPGTPGSSEADCQKSCKRAPPTPVTAPPTPAPPPTPKTPAPKPPAPTSPPAPVTPMPPAPAVYGCNTTSFKCEEVPAGTPGSEGLPLCNTHCAKNAPPTPKPTAAPVYACDWANATCGKVPAGTPGAGDLGYCTKICVKTPPPTPAPAPATPAPPRQCSKHLDLLFVLDGSGSIKADAWRIDLDATGKIAGSFEFGCKATSSKALAQMGIVQFADDASVEQPWTCDDDKFFATLTGLEQKKGFTFTGDALETAVQQFAAVPKDDARVAVLITDGVPCRPDTVNTCDRDTDPVPDATQAAKAKEQAAALKADGIEVMTIAVGNFQGKGLEFIKEISSAPSSKYVYNPTDWDKLPALLAQIIDNLCPPPSA